MLFISGASDWAQSSHTSCPQVFSTMKMQGSSALPEVTQKMKCRITQTLSRGCVQVLITYLYESCCPRKQDPSGTWISQRTSMHPDRLGHYLRARGLAVHPGPVFLLGTSGVPKIQKSAAHQFSVPACLWEGHGVRRNELSPSPTFIFNGLAFKALKMPHKKICTGDCIGFSPAVESGLTRLILTWMEMERFHSGASRATFENVSDTWNLIAC